MQAKSERITVLTTPDFKAYLHEEAAREGISVSELIRVRCAQPNQPAVNEDEQLLQAMVEQVKEATHRAQYALDKGLQDAEAVLNELKHARKH